MHWRTSKRTLDLTAPLVMGILNVTPDSFSDGGRFASTDTAVDRVEEMIAEGAGLVDIGGESTRPGSSRVSEAEEIERTVPVIEAVVRRFDVPVSIDTSKSAVAEAALAAGAEIVNDVSGLRFDPAIAATAARCSAGLVLMHSRGEFETMHSQPLVDDVFEEVIEGLKRAIDAAEGVGVERDRIVLDIGIGFGKTLVQNLQLIARLGAITSQFPDNPMLVGASRKSFLGKILGGAPATERLNASLAAAAIAVWNGASILRVHDVRATSDALKMVQQLIRER